MNKSEHSFKVFNSISSIEKETWNQLEIKNPLNLHGWLLTVEKFYKIEYESRYFLLYRNEQLICSVFGYIIPKSEIPFISARQLFGRVFNFAGRIGFSLTPLLYSGHLRGFGTTISFQKGLDHSKRSEYFRFLVDDVFQYATENQLNLCFARNFQINSLEFDLLPAIGFSRYRNSTTAHMYIRWGNFDEYVNYLAKTAGKRYKYDAIREMNKNKKAQVSYEVLESVDVVEDQLYELLLSNHKKYDASPYTFKPGFLKHAQINLGDRLEVEVAKKRGKIFGVQVILKAGPYINNYLISVDQQVSKGDMTYFVLCYYNGARRIEKEEVNEIQYGSGLLRVKKVRGCEILPSYDFIKLGNPIKNFLIRIWAGIQIKWKRRKKFSQQS